MKVTTVRQTIASVLLPALIGVSAACQTPAPAGAQSTNPAQFTTVRERVVHGSPVQIDPSTTAEVDDRSAIQIMFDSRMMVPAAPTVSGGSTSPRVTVQIDVFAIRGSARTTAAPIPNYVESVPGGTPPGAQPAGTTATSTIVDHSHSFNSAVNSLIPNTEFDLQSLGIADADQIEVEITNVETREQMIIRLVPVKFGFRPKVSDTMMFVRRLNVTKADQANGVSAFNFGPSPGVTYGATYLARNNRFVRFLKPGTGITVLFTKWDNPAFDISTGKFIAGTKASDIQIALGWQISFFSNVIQVGYGANLQVEQRRQYFSLGLSFVNLVSTVSGLINH
jgi:hypothetical protein